MDRKYIEALGSAAVTFVTAMAAYRGFSEITIDAVYQPLIQAAIVGLSALGFRVVPSRNGAPKP